jgi:hypothetical protein
LLIGFLSHEQLKIFVIRSCQKIQTTSNEPTGTIRCQLPPDMTPLLYVRRTTIRLPFACLTHQIHPPPFHLSFPTLVSYLCDLHYFLVFSKA